jgi:hypothetical protein
MDAVIQTMDVDRTKNTVIKIVFNKINVDDFVDAVKRMDERMSKL